jgi:hypothetical protein
MSISEDAWCKVAEAEDETVCFCLRINNLKITLQGVQQETERWLK